MMLLHLYFSSGTEKRHGIHVMHLHNPPAAARACYRVSEMIVPLITVNSGRHPLTWTDSVCATPYKNEVCACVPFCCRRCCSSLAPRCTLTSCRTDRQRRSTVCCCLCLVGSKRGEVCCYRHGMPCQAELITAHWPSALTVLHTHTH